MGFKWGSFLGSATSSALNTYVALEGVKRGQNADKRAEAEEARRQKQFENDQAYLDESRNSFNQNYGSGAMSGPSYEPQRPQNYYQDMKFDGSLSGSMPAPTSYPQTNERWKAETSERVKAADEAARNASRGGSGSSAAQALSVIGRGAQNFASGYGGYSQQGMAGPSYTPQSTGGYQGETIARNDFRAPDQVQVPDSYWNMDAAAGGKVDAGVAPRPVVNAQPQDELTQFKIAKAKEHGIDPSTVDRIIQLESGGRHDADNPKSSASGVLQLTDPTFVSLYRQRYAAPADMSDKDILKQKNDPRIQYDLGLYNLSQGSKSLKTKDPTDLYVWHHFGADMAPRLIEKKRQNPNMTFDQAAQEIAKDKAADAATPRKQQSLYDKAMSQWEKIKKGNKWIDGAATLAHGFATLGTNLAHGSWSGSAGKVRSGVAPKSVTTEAVDVNGAPVPPSTNINVGRVDTGEVMYLPGVYGSQAPSRLAIAPTPEGAGPIGAPGYAPAPTPGAMAGPTAPYPGAVAPGARPAGVAQAPGGPVIPGAQAPGPVVGSTPYPQGPYAGAPGAAGRPGVVASPPPNAPIVPGAPPVGVGTTPAPMYAQAPSGGPVTMSDPVVVNGQPIPQAPYAPVPQPQGMAGPSAPVGASPQAPQRVMSHREMENAAPVPPGAPGVQAGMTAAPQAPAQVSVAPVQRPPSVLNPSGVVSVDSILKEQTLGPGSPLNQPMGAPQAPAAGAPQQPTRPMSHRDMENAAPVPAMAGPGAAQGTTPAPAMSHREMENAAPVREDSAQQPPPRTSVQPGERPEARAVLGETPTPEQPYVPMEYAGQSAWTPQQQWQTATVPTAAGSNQVPARQRNPQMADYFERMALLALKYGKGHDAVAYIAAAQNYAKQAATLKREAANDQLTNIQRSYAIHGNPHKLASDLTKWSQTIDDGHDGNIIPNPDGSFDVHYADVKTGQPFLANRYKNADELFGAIMAASSPQAWDQHQDRILKAKWYGQQEQVQASTIKANEANARLHNSQADRQDLIYEQTDKVAGMDVNDPNLPKEERRLSIMSGRGGGAAEKVQPEKKKIDVDVGGAKRSVFVDGRGNPISYIDENTGIEYAWGYDGSFEKFTADPANARDARTYAVEPIVDNSGGVPRTVYIAKDAKDASGRPLKFASPKAAVDWVRAEAAKKNPKAQGMQRDPNVPVETNNPLTTQGW